MKIQSQPQPNVCSTVPNETSATTNDAFSSASVPDVLPGVNALYTSGDPGAMLAALTMLCAHAQSQNARSQRDAAMKLEASTEAAEIQDMRDKANLQRLEGIVDGACDVAQAGADMAQGMKALDATEDRLRADTMDGSTHAKGTTESNALRTDAAKAENAAVGWKSSGEAVAGLKSVLHGEFDGAMTDKDADAKVHEASAQAFKEIADDAHDNEKDAKDLLNKALDFFKEYTDTKNQTALAASHRA